MRMDLSATAPAKPHFVNSSTNGVSRCGASARIRSARKTRQGLPKKSSTIYWPKAMPCRPASCNAIESFAQELAGVLQRFLKLKEWRDAERLVFGGGFSGSRVGELAIGRASLLLKNEKIKTEVKIIRHDPDEAGLIGAAHLAPTWMFKAHDAILAVDIGGTNIRAGIVCLNLDDAEDLSKAEIGQFELWRHGDEKPSRQEAVDSLIGMPKRLTKAAKHDKLELAPFIGIGCRGALMPTSQLRPAARICRAIGRAAVSA